MTEMVEWPHTLQAASPPPAQPGFNGPARVDRVDSVDTGQVGQPLCGPAAAWRLDILSATISHEQTIPWRDV